MAKFPSWGVTFDVNFLNWLKLSFLCLPLWVHFTTANMEECRSSQSVVFHPSHRYWNRRAAWKPVRDQRWTNSLQFGLYFKQVGILFRMNDFSGVWRNFLFKPAQNMSGQGRKPFPVSVGLMSQTWLGAPVSFWTPCGVSTTSTPWWPTVLDWNQVWARKPHQSKKAEPLVLLPSSSHGTSA